MQTELMNHEREAKKIVVVTPNPHLPLSLTLTVNRTAYRNPDRKCDKIKNGNITASLFLVLLLYVPDDLASALTGQL